MRRSASLWEHDIFFELYIFNTHREGVEDEDERAVDDRKRQRGGVALEQRDLMEHGSVDGLICVDCWRALTNESHS